MSDDRLERIEVKIDKIATRMGNVDVTLAKQHVSLTEHIKRTKQLEDRVEPIERKVWAVDGVLKLVGILGIVFGICESVAVVLDYLKGA